MKFESYPHDIQVCSMMIESCKLPIDLQQACACDLVIFYLPVSHTVHDLVFIWNMTDPLVVNDEIELPQLDIAQNYTMDCTIPYSTGEAQRCDSSFELPIFTNSN